jgi:predicted  nucleic acid-binding Zn-ribbon protein
LTDTPASKQFLVTSTVNRPNETENMRSKYEALLHDMSDKERRLRELEQHQRTMREYDQRIRDMQNRHEQIERDREKSDLAARTVRGDYEKLQRGADDLRDQLANAEEERRTCSRENVDLIARIDEMESALQEAHTDATAKTEPTGKLVRFEEATDNRSLQADPANIPRTICFVI